jgi:hypothetical protein
MSKYKLTYNYLSDETMRLWAERDYEFELSKYADIDAYSRFDDWTISENDEPGSGKLRGTPYTLIDHNMIIYWCRDDYEGIEKFDKELFYEHSITEVTSKFLYRDSIDQIKRELCSGRGVSVDIRLNNEALNKET